MTNRSLLTHIFAITCLTTLLAGCGDKQTAAPAPPPPPPPPVDAAPKDAGKSTAEPGAAAVEAAPVDPAAEAKMAKEEQDKLAARIKAGEVGTTADPVVNRLQELLDTAYQNYFATYQKPPQSMQQLVAAGYLRAIPKLPAGKTFKIDPNGGGIAIVDGK